MIEVHPDDPVEIEVSGKLTEADYEVLVPEVERLAQERGPLRIYIELSDFRGWSPSGLWREVEFDVRHQDAMKRVAIVGEKAWEEWGTRLSKPFFKADVRYFPSEKAGAARSWVRED